MFKILLFLFIAIPLLEIYLLLQIGGIIGVTNTIALILLTAVIGTLLLMKQSLTTLARIQEAFDQAQLPTKMLIEGLVLLFAGVLLVTPGFFTDCIGFVCLAPVSRQWIANQFLLRLLRRHQQKDSEHTTETIEGEFWEEDKLK